MRTLFTLLGAAAGISAMLTDRPRRKDQSARDYLPTPSLAPIDMVVSRRRTLQRFAIQQKVPHFYFMRVYIAAERTFVNCEREISIQALHDECRRIAKRLTPSVPEPDAKPDERGSSMLVIADNTFPRTP